MQKQNYLKLMVLLLIGTCSIYVSGQNPKEINTPRTASPGAKISQTIGVSTVTVKYSRPVVNKREVWGALVPYGWNVLFAGGPSSPWRAGANENTVIEFSHAASVEGQPVPAGSYGLFFTINQDNTGELILSKDYHSWGSFSYDVSKDQLRAKIKLRDIPHAEQLSYDFINLTKNSGELVLNWEKKQFPVRIEFKVDEIVMANAGDDLKGVLGFNWEGYASAANYALQNNVNNAKGLEWINTAIRQNKSFGNLMIKADLLKQSGNVAEGDKINAEAMALPNIREGELNQYGYRLLTAGQKDKAIEVFVLMTKRYPESANAWDSLGEGYVSAGDNANAIKSFKKSLSLNPPAATKANSEKFLAQLGVK